ncbi:MAG TPA: hypothetical protein VKF39_03970 [Nitrososphaerales archaeon]|nr:hypothetical protein [Nitrososphaerales archaeon]
MGSGTLRSLGKTRPEGYAPRWYRAAEILLGLASVAVAVVVLANPTFGIYQLVLLLAVSIALNGIRMVVAGGIKKELMSVEGLGLVGGGIATLAIIVLVWAFPGITVATIVTLLAVALSIQGLGRILHAAGRGHARWLRGSALATGLFTVAVAVFVALVQSVALYTLAVVLAVVVLLNGVEGVVSGLRPTNQRQVTILKLVLFAAFYGLVLINWLDLYGTSAPAYHIWLVLTYMAPFGVLIVFQGFKDWQLALSLGLLVSLMNDVGYFFVGDLLFGFHRALLPWIEGQLGFLGFQVLFEFQGGLFTIPVTSVLMGLTIYGRIAVVSMVLYHWWKRPSRFDARL